MTTITYPSGITGPLPPAPPRRFTVAEYHHLIETGVFANDERYELINGWLVPKMTRNPPHDVCLVLVPEAIRRLLPRGWHVRIQSAITTDDSEPEPDIAVARGPARRYVRHHPSPADIAMLIEIAESSLDLDRDVKGPMYARAGIAIYWIINLVDNQVEVYTDPNGGRRPKYRRRRVFEIDSRLPLVIGGKEVERIAVRELLPL
jgi:Uma2 family endonuclease